MLHERKDDPDKGSSHVIRGCRELFIFVGDGELPSYEWPFYV